MYLEEIKLSNLSIENQNKALANIDAEIKRGERVEVFGIKSLNRTLIGAFIWSKSNEGLEYWSNLHTEHEEANKLIYFNSFKAG